MDISAKKSLGQNFLKDESILKKIACTIEPQKNDLILEIGPGKGALTKYLLNFNCYYVAYEIDKRLKPILDSITDQVHYKDFLKSDLKNDLSVYSYKRLFVVANIPYYITTPIIEHLINSKLPISQMVLLVQKEVAKRFCAKPQTKEYGYFTVYLQYYFETTMLFNVPRFCFSPIPNVDSTVVSFYKKNCSSLNEQQYFSFLKKCFASKRKTLRNNLKEYNWKMVFSILQKYQFYENVRAEEIPSFIFEEIFLALNS